MEYVMQYIGMRKQIISTWKVMIKILNHHISCFIFQISSDPNNLYGWAISQKLPVNGFKWEKNVSKFDEHIIKNYDENSKKGYILEVDVT